MNLVKINRIKKTKITLRGKTHYGYTVGETYWDGYTNQYIIPLKFYKDRTVDIKYYFDTDQFITKSGRIKYVRDNIAVSSLKSYW